MRFQVETLQMHCVDVVCDALLEPSAPFLNAGIGHACRIGSVGARWGKKWGKKSHRFQPISISRNPL
jgi:hypothetical protein